MKLLLLTAAFVSMAGVANAGTGPCNGGTEKSKSDITGGVVHADSKKPLGNVVVAAYSANKKEKVVMTDSHGVFTFNDLKPGTYRLVFEKDGYRKVTREKVLIRTDEGCLLNVELDEVGEVQIMPGLLFTDFD